MSRNYNILEINLEDNTPVMSKPVSTGSGATYEEAFLGGSSEEMSNLKGKGRARRQKRKLDRTAKKKERKLAKIEAKDEVKSAKADTRLERRRKKKAKRQDIRDEQMEARQQRRTKRMEMKEARKGKDEEEEEDEDIAETPTDSDEEEDTEDTQSTDTGADEEEEDDTSSDSRSEQSSDDPDAYEEDAGYDDDSSYDQYPTFEEEESFDGESSSFVSEMTGKKSVSAPIQQICLKIEWNHEMINRLARQKQKMAIDNQDTSRIDRAIDQKFERTQQLENQLQQFIGADGSRTGERAKEVNRAKRLARRKKLMAVVPTQVMNSGMKKGLSKQQIKEWWQSKGAKKYSSFSGETGWDGYPDVIYVDESPSDLMNYGQPTFDYDTDMGAEGGFDPMSFFDGGDNMSFANGEKSSDGSWVKSLVVGLLLGGVTIYVIRKYKLLS